MRRHAPTRLAPERESRLPVTATLGYTGGTCSPRTRTHHGPCSPGTARQARGTGVYTVRSVETSEELRACRRIRYSVYCVRKGWLSAEAYREDAEEGDEFDAGSEHFLAENPAG